MTQSENDKKKFDLEKNDYIQRLLKTIKKLQLRSSTITTGGNSSFVNSNKIEKEENNNCQPNDQNYDNLLRENMRLENEIEEMKNNFDELIDKMNSAQIEYERHLEIQEGIYRVHCEVEQKEKEMTANEIKYLTNQIEKIKKKCSHYEKFTKNNHSDGLDSSHQISDSHSTLKTLKKFNTFPKEYRNKIRELQKQWPLSSVENY